MKTEHMNIKIPGIQKSIRGLTKKYLKLRYTNPSLLPMILVSEHKIWYSVYSFFCFDDMESDFNFYFNFNLYSYLKAHGSF